MLVEAPMYVGAADQQGDESVIGGDCIADTFQKL